MRLVLYWNLHETPKEIPLRKIRPEWGHLIGYFVRMARCGRFEGCVCVFLWGGVSLSLCDDGRVNNHCNFFSVGGGCIIVSL